MIVNGDAKFEDDANHFSFTGNSYVNPGVLVVGCCRPYPFLRFSWKLSSTDFLTRYEQPAFRHPSLDNSSIAGFLGLVRAPKITGTALA
jgi:hypothetical protein